MKITWLPSTHDTEKVTGYYWISSFESFLIRLFIGENTTGEQLWGDEIWNAELMIGDMSFYKRAYPTLAMAKDGIEKVFAGFMKNLKDEVDEYFALKESKPYIVWNQLDGEDETGNLKICIVPVSDTRTKAMIYFNGKLAKQVYYWNTSVQNIQNDVLTQVEDILKQIKKE